MSKVQKKNIKNNNSKKNRNANRKVVKPEWKKKETPAEINAQPSPNSIVGGAGVDTRRPPNTADALKQALVLANQAEVMKVSSITSDKAIRNLSLGIVLVAIKAGLAAATINNGTNPYYMYRYLTESFISAMQGTIPAIQQAPLWYWSILYAIKRKQVKFKTAQVAYDWIIRESGIGDDSPIPMGIGPEAYSVVLTGSMTPGVTVYGFPVLGPNAPYTTELGQSSIAALWSFVPSTPEMKRMIGDPGLSAITANDVSAFSVVYPEVGSSFNTESALKTTIYSECPITTPLFAKFAQYQAPNSNYWRGWQKAASSGGSPCYIGPRIASLNKVAEMRTKVPPVFKFYNFDEFFEVLSLTLCQASSPALHNQGTSWSPCPLTSMQAQILLRQTIISVFSNERAQDLRFSEESTNIPFLPFVVGQNGYSVGTTMLLPTSLAENIRCCKSYTYNLARVEGVSAIIDYVSILGRPAGIGQLDNYYVHGETALYAESQPINFNLIDCSSISNNTTYYVDLTREELSNLTSNWNVWIKSLATNLTPLTTITTAEGISCLKTNSYTNVMIKDQPATVPPTVALAKNKELHKRNSKASIIKIGEGCPKVKKMTGDPFPGTGYFDTVRDRFTLSSLKVSSPVWRVLSGWILPCLVADMALIQDMSLQGVAAFYVEPYKVPRSTNGGVGSVPGGDDPTEGPSAYDRHVNMASWDVKAIAQDGQDDIIEFILKQGEKGRGGFLELLSELAGPIASVIAPVAGAVSKMF